MQTTFKARNGWTVRIDPETGALNLDKGRKSVSTNKVAVRAVEMRRSVYDLPLIETSIALKTITGKYVIRRLKKRDAKVLRDLLTS